VTDPEPRQLSLGPSDPGGPAAAAPSVEMPAPEGWPEPPAPDVYHGVCGAIIEKLAPHTEADPIAILSQLLIACGSAIGPGPHFQIEATHHRPSEFLLLVGDSAKSRKGSSLDHVARLMRAADPDFDRRLSTGLSSGEGVVWALRDPQQDDVGAADKRLLVIEPEFAAVLKTAAREISTLSPTLRSAWDGRPLQLLTRTAPVRSTGAHLSLIGHITAPELRRYATSLEIANGFLNRFLIVCCRRVRLLPEGGQPDPLARSGLPRYLAAALKQARRQRRLAFDSHARALWRHAYPQLTQPADGLVGHLTARAEAHTIRLALIYALIDDQTQIYEQHLKAALAFWDYAARSAAWTLGQTTGDPIAEQIHAALIRSPDGLTRTQIRDLCQRNLPGQRLDQALANLAAAGRATRQRTLTAGRPAERWTGLAWVRRRVVGS
jgi:hypothetical protein